MSISKVIGIGCQVDRKLGIVTGLAMMFELTMSVFRDAGYKVSIISLNSRFNSKNSKVATPGISRYFDYTIIFIETFWRLLFFRDCIVYINPATTIYGLKRDALVVKIAKSFGHKIVFQQFGALFNAFYNSLSAELQSKLHKTYNYADALIVEGEFARCQYPFISNQEKIHIVNNALPEKLIDCLGYGKLYIEDETFNLIFMNNMIESKGYIDVLKAMDILVNQRHLTVKCTFAGRFLKVPDDMYFKNTVDAQLWFDNFVKDKHLESCITYSKCIFGLEKSSTFKKSHAFLLPSYYIFEGQPTAILEALAYGCVPIVTNYRLIPDMVDESCGIFVEPKSAESIANAVEYLIKHPEKYAMLSKGSVHRYEKKFTKDKYAFKISGIVSSL